MGTNYFASQQKKEKIHSLFLQTAVNASMPRGVEPPPGWTEPCLKDARKPFCRGYGNMILSPCILYVGFLFTYLMSILLICLKSQLLMLKSSCLRELAQRSVSWQYKGNWLVALFSNLTGKNYLLFCLTNLDHF